MTNLSDKREQGTLPEDLSPGFVRQLVQSFKAEFKANAANARVHGINALVAADLDLLI